MDLAAIQFLNQYSFLFVCAAVLVGAALQLRLRQARRRWWGAWGMVALANVGMVMMLPTPAATLSEHEAAEPGMGGSARPDQPMERPWFPESVSDIEAIVDDGDRPTLVEFYSDFGLG